MSFFSPPMGSKKNCLSPKETKPLFPLPKGRNSLRNSAAPAHTSPSIKRTFFPRFSSFKDVSRTFSREGSSCAICCHIFLIDRYSFCAMPFSSYSYFKPFPVPFRRIKKYFFPNKARYSNPPSPRASISSFVTGSSAMIRGSIKSNTVIGQNITLPGSPIMGTLFFP